MSNTNCLLLSSVLVIFHPVEFSFIKFYLLEINAHADFFFNVTIDKFFGKMFAIHFFIRQIPFDRFNAVLALKCCIYVDYMGGKTICGLLK